MRYHEWLIKRINGCLDKGKPIPSDLFSEALAASLDVSSIETQHEKENQ